MILPSDELSPLCVAGWSAVPSGW